MDSKKTRLCLLGKRLSGGASEACTVERRGGETHELTISRRDPRGFKVSYKVHSPHCETTVQQWLFFEVSEDGELESGARYPAVPDNVRYTLDEIGLDRLLFWSAQKS